MVALATGLEASTPEKRDGGKDSQGIQSVLEYTDSIEDVRPQETSIKRGLSSRHAQFIAIGGSVGTGLFLSAGGTLAKGGPAFLVGSYVLMSCLVYLIIVALGEISAYLPLPGGTMNYYGTRYVSRSLGFAMGWLYFYSYAIFIPWELTASALVIDYWKPPVNIAVWITIMLLVVVVINFLPVKFYGESEFWFALLKVLLIVGLIILSFILFWGGGPSHDRLGFRYWKHPGPVNTYIVGGDAGRFVAALATLISSALPFFFSPEMVVVTAGEVKSPRRTMPKILRGFFWRLIVFYIGGMVAISVICPSNDPALAKGGYDVTTSPWVVGIQNAGIHGLNHVVNAVVLTASFSAGNSFVYLASRSLYSLALEGQAPAIFKRCNRHGVPAYAVGVSCLFALLAYMNVNTSSSNVFNWLLNLVSTGGFLSSVCCSIVYIRFRKACDIQQVPKDKLTGRSILQPIGSWITLVAFLFLTLANGFTVFFPSKWSVSNFLSAYIGIPLFLIVYLGHRAIHRTERWLIPSHLVDLQTGLAEVEAAETPGRPKSSVRERLYHFWGHFKRT